MASLPIVARRRTVSRFVDKLPHNFRHAGFIRMILPKARIIHLNRDVRASGWSIFKTLFSRDNHPYSYDFESLAAFIRAYQGLMAHWRSIEPQGWFHDLSYEDLVADPEPHVRALLAACGLNWEPACLEFHKTDRAVATASFVQVRQPLYTGSLEHWRRHEAALKPFLDALTSSSGGS